MTRMITPAQAAAHIGRTAHWLKRHRAELELNGFPKPDPLFDRYDILAVDAWLDQRAADNYAVDTQQHSAIEAELRMSQKIAALSA